MRRLSRGRPFAGKAARRHEGEGAAPGVAAEADSGIGAGAGIGMGAAIPRRLRFGAAAAIGILLSGLLSLTGVAAGLDRFFYDLEARGSASLDAALSAGRSSGTSQVALIYVDQYSLGWVEKNLGLSWPWPRELYGVIAGFCSQAKAQAFDVLFSEASGYGPGDDARCAAAMDRAGNVVLAEARDSRGGERLAPLPTERVAFGRVSGLVDADGVLRRYRPSEGGQGGDSLGLAALAAGGDRPQALPAETVYLRFSGSSPAFPAWNAAEIIASAMAANAGGTPQVDPARFTGSYVFVGFSAPGLLDRQAVPTDPAMPGAEIHATFVDNALKGRLLAPLPRAAALGAALVLAIGAAAAAAALAAPAALAGAAGLLGLLPPLAGFTLYRSGWVSPTGLWLAAGLSAYAAGILLAYAAEGRTRAFLRRSFSQYLSPAVVDELVRNPGALRLGGEERTISVFFSDIQGFTALSESMPPARLAAFMNCYLSLLTGEILAEGGTVDKYVGDAIVAFWNAPMSQPDHAERAVRAALRCQAALAASAERFAALGAAIPITRIGVHTGGAIVGNMGSPSRFNYTALGDVVNTASRLEEANKATGTSILVSGETVRACGPANPAAGAPMPMQAPRSDAPAFRRLGELSVRNRAAPVEVWEPRLAGEEPGPAKAWEGILDCRRL